MGDKPIILDGLEITEIKVTEGQTLTVWLGGEQVELRVLPSGEPEVYVEWDDGEHRVAHNFAGWEPMPA